MHVCQVCAQSKSEELNDKLNMSDFLGGLADIGFRESKKHTSNRCLSCGLSYEEFKKKGRLGCEQCYTAFRQYLLPLLKKIHSSSRHAGKVPLQARRKDFSNLELTELRRRLMRAIQLEEYEDAAKLRDKMKRLEDKNKPS